MDKQALISEYLKVIEPLSGISFQCLICKRMGKEYMFFCHAGPISAGGVNSAIGHLGRHKNEMNANDGELSKSLNELLDLLRAEDKVKRQEAADRDHLNIAPVSRVN